MDARAGDTGLDGEGRSTRSASGAANWAWISRGVVWGIFAACCALPVGWMVVSLLSEPGAWRAIHPVSFHLKLLARTLAYNGAAALLATLLALPVAGVIGRGRGWFSGLLMFLLPAALLLPSIVYAYGWMQVLRVAGHFIHGVYPMPGSLGDVARCVWTLAGWLWPIPAGVIGLSWRRLDMDLQQQALLDGAYWRIMFRQLSGPAIAAMAMVAVLAMQEFAVYEPTGISVVATEVRTVFETGQAGSMTNAIAGVKAGMSGSFEITDQHRNAAAALVTALPMFMVILVLTGIVARLLRRDSGGERIDAGPIPAVIRAGWKCKLLAAGVLAMTLALPIGTMIGSVSRPFDIGRIWRTFSPLITGTLSVGIGAAAIAAILATCGMVRRMTWPLALGLGTFLIGGQMLAIALIRLYNQKSDWISWVYTGPTIVLMAYVARFGWLAMWAARGTWSPRWRELREMAAMDGAGGAAVARRVIIPLAWPLVAASGVLVMLLSMTEVPATVLLNPMRPQVFIPMLMSWVHTLHNDDMLEGSLLLAATVMVLAGVVFALLAMTRRISTAGTAGLILAAVLLAGVGGCDKSDQPKAIWLETGAGEGQVVYPRALCYDKSDDSFYVCDRMARIQHLDREGKFLNGWRMPDWSQGKPVGMSVGSDGNLWVPDTHYSRVLVFSKKGEVIKHFGKEGRGPGEFIYPSDIAFDSKGRIFVSEFGDHDRIQVFDQNLKYLSEFGQFGAADGQFSRPQSMLVVPEAGGEMMYVTDACNHRISVWTTDGHFVRNMGRIGSALGEFRFPYGLDIDSKGRLVVCEFGNNRVQLVDRQTGQGIAAWGSAGREPGRLAYPWGVVVDRKDRVIAVDAGNNRLQVFEF